MHECAPSFPRTPWFLVGFQISPCSISVAPVHLGSSTHPPEHESVGLRSGGTPYPGLDSDPQHTPFSDLVLDRREASCSRVPPALWTLGSQPRILWLGINHCFPWTCVPQPMGRDPTCGLPEKDLHVGVVGNSLN